VGAGRLILPATRIANVVIVFLLLLQSSLKKLLQVPGEPITAVCLVIPTEHGALVNLAICVNGEGKMIPAAVVSKQQKVVEGHVEVLERRRRPKLSVLLRKVAN
jgi:hypothetical protein